MIARSRPQLFLRGKTIGHATAISLGLCLLFPCLALAAWLLGAVAWLSLRGLVLAIIGLLWVFEYGGWLLLVGGLLAAAGGSNKDAKETGSGLAVLSIIPIVVGHYGRPWWGGAAPVVDAGAGTAFRWGYEAAATLLGTVWIGWGAGALSWLVLATELAIAAGLLMAIGALRLYDRSRGPMGRIYYACPDGHREGISFACPDCGQWEDRLTASRYGLLRAACTCGRELPTMDFVGRRDLPKCCLRCRRPLVHPDLGSRPEYHIAVWGDAEAAKTGWLRACLAAASAAGGRVIADGSGSPPRPFPAPIVALPAPEGGLLYLYDLPVEECRTTGLPAADDYHRWLDAIVLVLGGPDDTRIDGPGTVGRVAAALLERWDRLHVGRVAGRHRAPLAVVVSRQAVNPFLSLRTDSGRVRHALEGAGLGDTLHALETRFRHVGYFLVGRAERGGDPRRPPLIEPLRWIERQLGPSWRRSPSDAREPADRSS